MIQKTEEDSARRGSHEPAAGALSLFQFPEAFEKLEAEFSRMMRAAYFPKYSAISRMRAI